MPWLLCSKPSQSSGGLPNLWVVSCHAWCFNPVCFDRFAQGKLRTDSNSPSSWKGFIPWRTTKSSDTRKYKPHRPWNLPFCYKNSSMLQTRRMSWDTLEGSFVSFFIGCFTQVSLELPSREGRGSQCWNYVSISICHESFGLNHKKGFLSLPESVLFFLCGTARLHQADFIIWKNESRMPNQVLNITPNH